MRVLRNKQRSCGGVGDEARRPARAEADFAGAVRRHFRWNTTIIAGVEGCWGFSEAFISQAAILPAFLKLLGASDIVLGLLPAVFTLCLMGPQLLAARWTQPLPIKKVVFTFVHYPGCLSFLPLSVVVWFFSERLPGVVIGATFMASALFGLSISFAMPMWVNLMAKLFPDEVRGRTFGYVFLLGALCGALGSAVASRILAVYPFPHGFAVLFAVAGVLMTLCVTSFLWLREPVLPVEEKHGRSFWAGLVAILHGSPDYRWFLVSRFIGSFSLMAGAFYTVAGLTRFDLPASTAGTFGAILLLGRSIGSLVAGRFGDHFGFKPVAALVPVLDLAAALLALLAPSAAWYYGVFAIFGFRGACAMVGNHNLSIEFCPLMDKTTFVALGSTIVCPALVLGPGIGGLLATYHPARYDAVFATSLVSSAVAFAVMVLLVREPRRQR